jgi:hypothetical protein
MVGIFVMLVVTIALVAGASASAYFLLNSTQASLMVQQNQIRVQSVSASIRSAISTFDGRDVVPLRSKDGSTSAFVARVPSIAAFDKTTSGRDIIFCPVVYSDEINPNASVENGLLSGGVETYPVEAATKGGRSYMVAGYPAFSKMSAAPADAAKSLNQSGIFGFLISGDPRRDVDLRCSSVEMVSAGTFIVDGGTVQPIYGETKDRPASTYVISSTTAVTELGDDQKPVGALKDALHLISKYDQANATIYIDGNLSITDAERAQLEDVAFGRSLKLIGQTASTLTFQTTGSGRYALQLRGDVLFSNLTLTSSNGRPVGVDALPSSRIDIDSTDMNFVRASGGVVFLEGQSHIVTTNGSAVDAAGGSITFAIPGTASSIISSSGSPIFAISGGRVLAQTSIYIDASASETLYVSGTNKSVDKATGATIFLNGAEPATLASPYYRPTPVKCANGAASCAVQCTAGTIIAWGECASDNDSPLAGFYADTAGQTYTCKWASGLIPVSNPTAAVVCTNPQH